MSAPAQAPGGPALLPRVDVAPAPAPQSDRLSLAEYTRRVLVAVGIVVLAVALWKVAGLAVVAFAGVVAAVLVRAIAEPLARFTGLGDRLAVAIVVLALAALVSFAFWLIGETLVAQVTQLWSALPGALSGMRRWAEQWPAGRAQRWAVSLPPALGMLAVVVFGVLLGLPGVILAVPLMVVAMILVQKLYIEAALGESATPGRAPTSGAGG